MKYQPLAFAFLLFSAWCGLTALNPNNPPTGRTGAPGETTCGASGCHTGGSFTGTVTVTGLPDTVAPDQTYMLTLTHTSNATRAGFQLTCLDSLNVKAGTLTGATGVGVATGNNRQYARQTSPKNLTAGATAWTFSWKAPTTASNPLKFYFASLAANGNGQRTGDNPLLGTRSVYLASPSVGTQQPAEVPSFDLFPNPATEWLHVGLANGAGGTVRLYDAGGRLRQEQPFTGMATVDVRALPAGVYTATVETAGRISTRRWVKQ